MVQINFASREINCKIVYYGPGRCGKTTNLQVVHAKAPQNSTGELVSIATETDRTLYFDFLPLDLGTVAGMRTKFQLYTVPGQVYYDATRKLVLQGCDGIVFVADSNPDLMAENIESLDNLAKNLQENNLDIMEIPLVLQFNKRDLPNALPVEELNAKLNRNNWPVTEAVAVNGDGVFQTLKAISQQVIRRLNREQGYSEDGTKRAPAKKSASARVPAVLPTTRAAAVPPPASTQVAAPPPPPPPPPAVAAPAPRIAAAAVKVAPPPAPVLKAPPVPLKAPVSASRSGVQAVPPAAPTPAAPVSPPSVTKTQPVPPAGPPPMASAARSKTEIFRDRMAELRRKRQETSEPSDGTEASGSLPAPKKKGCLGMILIAVSLAAATAWESVRWLS